MKKLSQLLLGVLSLLTLSTNVYSQAESCGNEDVDSTYFYSLPWIGNNHILIHCPAIYCKGMNDSFQTTMINKQLVFTSWFSIGCF